jgi:DNA-binding NarL/FixJ family response regulator
MPIIKPLAGQVERGSQHQESGPRRPPARLLVVEDHTLVREGIVALLRESDDLIVCAEASTSATALQSVQALRPDLAIVDYFLGETEDGTHLIRDLVALQPSLFVVSVSLSSDDDLAERALNAGARGFVSKFEGTSQLLNAVRIVLAGGVFASPALRARLNGSLAGMSGAESVSPFAGLTHRELQVFQLLGAGLGISEIARRLGVSVKTVGAHREHLKDKLTCESAEVLGAKAARWVQRGGVP